MSDIEHWLIANDQYLAASVAWLRDRLERLGTEATLALPSGETEVAQPVQPGVAPRRSLIGRLLRSESKAEEAVKALPPARQEPRRQSGPPIEMVRYPAALATAE